MMDIHSDHQGIGQACLSAVFPALKTPATEHTGWLCTLTSITSQAYDKVLINVSDGASGIVLDTGSLEYKLYLIFAFEELIVL